MDEIHLDKQSVKVEKGIKRKYFYTVAALNYLLQNEVYNETN